MLLDSSKDYFTGQVVITFDGDAPTREEVNMYCMRNYGFAPGGEYEIEPPNDFMGYINPGTLTCFQPKEEWVDEDPPC